MSLLTPSESRAFQSFLDAAAFPVDWSMQLEISHEHMPPARGTEALTKATKDLMSLDGERWRHPLGPCSSGESSVTSVHRLANPLSAHLGSSTHDQLTQLPFYQVISSTADPKRTRADPHPCDHSSSSSSSRQSPIDLLTLSSSTAALPLSGKRSPPPDAHLSNKRHRSSTSQDPSDEAQPLPQNRTALLSPSQKKANHIQSEQKRRANIRRGYDTLCETVPALRDACQAEDEQQLVDGKPKGRRRGKGKIKGDDSERVDGRAGPRSENVVLSKTIDYLHELLSERELLMQRLHVACNALPINHPLRLSEAAATIPLWERKWSGGEEKGNDDDDDDDDD